MHKFSEIINQKEASPNLWDFFSFTPGAQTGMGATESQLVTWQTYTRNQHQGADLV